MQTGRVNWQAKQFAQMDDAEQHLATSNIVREADNVNAVYLECSERAINSLFLLNSGGAATVIAYIYNIKDSPVNIFIKISLLIFLVGLVLAFYVVARDFYYAQKKSLEFHGDVREFLLKDIPFNSIRRFQLSSEQVNGYAMLTIKLGEISAYCAVGGIVFGLFGYFWPCS